jgi:D-sedoheptulose 7-phosphate isomerase
MPREHESYEWDFGKAANLSIEKYFQQLGALMSQLPYAEIERIVSLLLKAFEEDRTVFVFGNGGSAAIASHMMCDMNKGASGLDPARRPRLMALTDNVPLISAYANDLGYERIFSEQLRTFIRPKDVVFAISTSGDSPNILLALETAHEHGALTLGLAGCHGGRMKTLCDRCIVVPSENIQMIEDMHHAIAHSIFTAVRDNLRVTMEKTLAARAGSF